MASHGVLAGERLPLREIARLGYQAGPLWRDAKTLVRVVAICLAESQGYTRAHNDNLTRIENCSVGQVVWDWDTVAKRPILPLIVLNPAKGSVRRTTAGASPSVMEPSTLVVTSRDCGPLQCNIKATSMGTDAELLLYDPFENFARGYELYTTPLGGDKIREFQPWAAHESDVFLHDTYAARALLGVVNLLGEDLCLEALAAGQLPLYRPPFISVPTARKLYPDISFG